MMAIQADDDPVRGLGFVTLYAAYLEEQIDNLLIMLQPIEAFPEQEQRWQTSKKIEKARRLVATLTFEYRDGLLDDLDSSRSLLEWRNEVVHGRIYAHFDRPDTLKSGRPNTLDRSIDAAELYELANSLSSIRDCLYRPMLFQIPAALP
jgi:hypothetical protein